MQQTEEEEEEDWDAEFTEPEGNSENENPNQTNFGSQIREVENNRIKTNLSLSAQRETTKRIKQKGISLYLYKKEEHMKNFCFILYRFSQIKKLKNTNLC